MGNRKQKWTSEEEEALRAGVAKHGAGKWKNIQKDPEFNHLLFSRSNIDLKVTIIIKTGLCMYENYICISNSMTLCISLY